MPVAAEVLVGIISSIVYDGLKRPFRGLSEAVSRRRNISKALSGANTSDAPEGPDQKRAILDLVRILGNDHNAYTNHVAEFLQEVERSAIPDALKQFALCGYDPQDAFAAFDLIYSSYSPLPFSSLELFNALNAAITTRIEHSIEEKVLFEAIKAQHENIATRISSLSASLRNARALDEPLPAAEFREIREKIARGIESANRTINVETTQGTRKINIKKLVIAARLDLLPEKGQVPSPHREAHIERDQSITYLTFRRTFNRAVILGDPGGGKSTLTQLLCFDLANQINLAAANPGYGGFDSRDMRLPLRIILRALEKRQQQVPSYQIFDYLIDEIRVHCDNDKVLAGRFLKQILSLGQAVVLFDGLDEVLDVGARRSMATIIEQFLGAYAACPGLVTSRIVGYSDAPMGDDYQMQTLSRFNGDEVRKFSEQLLKAITTDKAAIAREKALQFIRQTEDTAGDLRENPLLLGLMIYIFNARGEVPSNRPEIYKECSVLMFEKWDQRRDIKFDLPQDFDLLDLFGYLATQIFGNADTEDGVDEDWLMERLKTYFNLWYRDRARSVAAAKVLVEFITGRAWVMCEIGPGIFKFTHRTFLEYFFAKRTEEEAGSVNGLIHGTLIGKIIRAQWDVVSHLALQIATFRSGPKSVQAVDTLLQIGTNEHFSPEEEINFLSFFARSLEYLLLPEMKLGNAIDHIFRRSIYLGAKFSLSVSEVISYLLVATRKRDAVARDKLVVLADPILKGPSCPERTYLFYLSGTKFFGYHYRYRAEEFFDLVWRTFRPLRDSCRDDQYKRALVDLNEARSYFYAYGDRVLDLYKAHGPKFLLCPSGELIPFEISHLAFILINEMVRQSSGGSGPRFYLVEVEKSELIEVITAFSDTLLEGWCAGSIGQIVPAPDEGDRYGIIDELYHYLGYQVDRRKTISAKKLLVRAAFSYVMISGGYRNREQFDRIMRVSRRRQIKEKREMLFSVLEGDKFFDVLAEIDRTLI